MADLIYCPIASLDGYTVDVDGDFSWSAPDEEVHEFVNDVSRGVGTMLLGRRMYDVLAVWETMDVAGQPSAMRDFQAIWGATDKVVYSRTLDEVGTARTRIARNFDPREVAELKATADRDLTVAGPELAAQALQAGLVDEVQLFLNPVAVGGGTPAMPRGQRIGLDLLEERRFGNGTVFLRYAVLR